MVWDQPLSAEAPRFYLLHLSPLQDLLLARLQAAISKLQKPVDHQLCSMDVFKFNGVKATLGNETFHASNAAPEVMFLSLHDCTLRALEIGPCIAFSTDMRCLST